MIERASREIRRQTREDAVRRREAARMPALVRALDDLLTELEELMLAHAGMVSEAGRRRAAELIAEALRMDVPPALPETVADLMERVYEAQDAALLRRRRAGWGLDEPVAPRQAAVSRRP